MKTDLPGHLRLSCERMITEGFRFLLNRWEQADDYAFVDMKLKVLTGEDFPAAVPGRRSIYDRNVIYGVIQGRAIESIAGHLQWLPSAGSLDAAERASLAGRGRIMLREAVHALETLRAACGGHTYFMMDAGGGALRVAGDGDVAPWDPPPGNTDTDLFYFKGLMAAAKELDDARLLAEADQAFRSVVRDAMCDDLLNDRQPMDPKNVVQPVPGRITHGPKMLSLGGIATGIALNLNADYWRLGANVIQEIVSGHVNRGQFSGLEIGDFVEFIDPAGQPWKDGEGRVWQDPGHALEFIGLASKVILCMRKRQKQAPPHILPALEALAAEWFPLMFRQSFELGFNREHEGMMKAVDLVRRRPINPDMPWWNLPETIRAAALLTEVVPETDSEPFTRAIEACHQATMNGYARAELGFLPVQTRGPDGQPADVIPAMPDADPLYHTGLTLIDVLGPAIR